MAIQQLPIISYKQLDTQAERERLLWAASEVGFFYLVEHGLSEADLDAVLRVSRRFFALSQAAKEQVSMAYSPHFRGYNAVGQEVTAGAVDMREQFDWMNEEPAPKQLQYDWQRVIGPNLWPAALPPLREQLLSLTLRQTEIAVTLLRALCQALGVAWNALDDSFRDGPYTHSKIIRYPGTEASSQGVGAHKDPGYLTFVLQDQQSGLEVEHQGEWLDVEPLSGSFVVNIGELLELASDGFLQATNHRVRAPKPGTERFSVAYFMAAQLDATVPVLDLPAAMKAKSKGVSTDPNNPLLSQVGENVLKGRVRSHPDAGSLS
ncbi:2-oxobutyrate oxidase [Idiomarina sp. OT37-5b]|uniref:isopenicillin N synthase family dioxygenase n=1 Tax=Idiomarina sp. OT37-5b TaxID=2100422 RepID=UPI000CFA1569|nr:2-oxoglutarate and iron-dependent oxygenase domain-containing protein [Idiomarina sp. OT37-5b]AVJ55469.1 2-oxobutyrate oxidase [Idiomarina sp. OT37-5b]